MHKIVHPLQQSTLFDSIISLASAVKQYPQTQKQAADSSIAVSNAFSGLKVLLAEDNDINQIIAKEFFKDHGIVPKIVGNGKEAQEAAKTEQFDLIYLDCHMPVMDGLEAARLIRDNEVENKLNRTPIIALTADVTVEIQNKCKESGMDFYLTKPLDPMKLATTLKNFSNLQTVKVMENQTPKATQPEVKVG